MDASEKRKILGNKSIDAFAMSEFRLACPSPGHERRLFAGERGSKLQLGLFGVGVRNFWYGVPEVDAISRDTSDAALQFACAKMDVSLHSCLPW